MLGGQATGAVSWSSFMNFLALIQAKQRRANAKEQAKKAVLVYRGVPYVKFA